MILRYLAAVLGTLIILTSCAENTPEVKVLYYVSTESDPLDSKIMAIVQQKLAGSATVTFELLGSEAFEARLRDGQFWNRPHDLIAWTPSETWSTMIAKQRVKDLQTTLSKDYLEAFIPSAITPRNQRGGRLTVLPNSMTITHVLYVNQELLASQKLTFPRTYEELKAQVPLLRAAGLVPIIYSGRDFGSLASTVFPVILARVAGADFASQVATGTKKFTDPEFIAALETFRTLVSDGVIDMGNGTTDREAATLFASGRSPYLVGGDWLAHLLGTDPTTGQSLLSPDQQSKISLESFPELPRQRLGSPQATMIPDGGYGMSATLEDGSPQALAAAKVLEALQSHDVQLTRLNAHAGMSARLDVDNPEAEPIKKLLQSHYRETKVTLSCTAVFNQQILFEMADALRAIATGQTKPTFAAQHLEDLRAQTNYN